MWWKQERVAKGRDGDGDGEGELTIRAVNYFVTWRVM